MQCKNCQFESEFEGFYCQKCGSRIKDKCPFCDNFAKDERPFCASCGKSLTTSDDTINILARTGKLDIIKKYMPVQLFHRIIEGDAKIVGERRDVTIIFADIGGFTTYSENHEPEEVTKMLNECFQGLVEAVERYEGMVNKFIGDCIMAVFGAPTGHEDDPERAVRCAIDMLKFIQKYNMVIDSPLALSIGVNTGPAVAGNIGGASQMEYTVIGDTVNLSQRLQSASEKGQILVGEFVYERAKNAIDFAKLSPIKVKGKKNPVPVYEVLGIKSEESKKKEKISLPLIGRKNEIELFTKEINEISKRRIPSFFVSGEAGIGKTRLIDEMVKNFTPDVTFNLHIQSYARREPYWIFKELIKKMLNVTGDDPALIEAEFDKVEEDTIEATDKMFLKYLLLGDKYADTIKSLEYREKKLGIFHAILIFLIYKSERMPLFIILENIHNADELSSEILLKIIEETTLKINLTFILSSRSRERYEKIPANLLIKFNLLALADNEISELIKTILKTDEIPEELLWLLKSKAKGNPLLTIEIVKRLIDSKKLISNIGKWYLDKNIDAIQLPSNLSALFSARVDSLNANSRRLLSVASIIGYEFKLDVLSSIAENFQKRYLDTLIEEEFLENTNDNLRFANPNIYEVVYSLNLDDELRKTHTMVGNYLEKIFNDENLMPIYDLAYHFGESDDDYKAIYYLEKAGSKYFSDMQLAESRKNFAKCQDVLDTKGLFKLSDEEKIFKKIDILYKIGEIDMILADYTNTLSLFQNAEQLANKLGKKVYIARSLNYIGRVFNLMAKYDESLATQNRAMEIARGENDDLLNIKILGDLAEVYQNKGQTKSAIPYLKEVLTILNRLESGGRTIDWGSDHPAKYFNLLGGGYLKSADVGSALTCFNKAIELCQKYDNKLVLSRAIGNIGSLYGFKKEYENACEYTEKAVALSKTIGDKMGEAKQSYNLGSLSFILGKKEIALSLFKRSYKIAREIKWKEGVAMNSAYLDKLKGVSFEKKP